jgi:hypothetical protein
MKQGISCQNINLKLINSDCIYRNFFKNAKRQTQKKGLALMISKNTTSRLLAKEKI